MGTSGSWELLTSQPNWTSVPGSLRDSVSKNKMESYREDAQGWLPASMETLVNAPAHACAHTRVPTHPYTKHKSKCKFTNVDKSISSTISGHYMSCIVHRVIMWQRQNKVGAQNILAQRHLSRGFLQSPKTSQTELKLKQSFLVNITGKHSNIPEDKTV